MIARALVAAFFLASAAVASGAATFARVSSPTVSADTRTVYAITRGQRVALLHACAKERFFPASSHDIVTPSLSPDGRWLLIERVYPFEAHGRVDESKVLLDVATGRSFASPFYGKLLGTGTPIATTWATGKPATMHVEGDLRTRSVALPGPLAGVTPPNRCG